MATASPQPVATERAVVRREEVVADSVIRTIEINKDAKANVAGSLRDSDQTVQDTRLRDSEPQLAAGEPSRICWSSLPQFKWMAPPATPKSS